MMQPAVRVGPAIAAVLAAVFAAAGCAGATSAAAPPATPPAAESSAPLAGPPAPDAACAAARKAEQTLQARQGKDQGSQSAIDKDFTNFAGVLNAAAQHEKHPAAAIAMTALANDYTALVESQSGAAPLPSMSAIQDDGAAFDKACP